MQTYLNVESNHEDSIIFFKAIFIKEHKKHKIKNISMNRILMQLKKLDKHFLIIFYLCYKLLLKYK